MDLPDRPERARRGLRGSVAALVLGLVLVLAGAGGPATALGACAAVPPAPDEAVLLGDIVFVGTVLRAENGGRWPTVRVEERWKGARDLASTVVVRGGPEPGAATSVDRTYEPGRYLFVVRAKDGVLQDDACSGTRPWTADLASLRPAGVTPAAEELPTDPLGSIDTGELAVVAGLLVALLVAIVAYLAVLRARRRPPDWRR